MSGFHICEATTLTSCWPSFSSGFHSNCWSCHIFKQNTLKNWDNLVCSSRSCGPQRTEQQLRILMFLKHFWKGRHVPALSGPEPQSCVCENPINVKRTCRKYIIIANIMKAEISTITETKTHQSVDLLHHQTHLHREGAGQRSDTFWVLVNKALFQPVFSFICQGKRTQQMLVLTTFWVHWRTAVITNSVKFVDFS